MKAKELAEILLKHPDAEVKLFAASDRWEPIIGKGISHNYLNNTTYIGL